MMFFLLQVRKLEISSHLLLHRTILRKIHFSVPDVVATCASLELTLLMYFIYVHMTDS